MSTLAIRSEQSTVNCKWLQEYDNFPCSAMDKALLQTWTGQSCQSTTQHVQPQPPPTIVLVLVEDVFQYFMDNPNADTIPVFLAGQAHSGTETVFIRLSTFVPHFLPPHFLSSREQDAKGNTKTDSDSACTAGLTPGMQSLGGLAEGF